MGTQFGHYELHGLLGRGGMGEVHRAFDRGQQRFVALKLLSPHLATDARFVERFRREAMATASLNDPHVIPIHQAGEIDGRLYIDMRLVEGSDLSEVLEARGPLPPPEAVRVVQQAAEALDAAHARGLLHRDVKPSNLLLTTQGFVYLVDFGLVQFLEAAGAPLTSMGQTIGTFAYMAPERMGGDQPVDRRADVYSLTCVLFEALTGRRPFADASILGLTRAHLYEPPPRVTDVRPDLPAVWDQLVARGMAKDPAQRFPTAGALAAAAAEALGAPPPDRRRNGPVRPDDDTVHRPVPPSGPPGAEPPVAGSPAGRGRRRAWLVAAVAATVALAVLAVVAVTGGWFTGGDPEAASSTTSTAPTTSRPPTTPPSTTPPPTTPPPTTPPPPPTTTAFDPRLTAVFPDLAGAPGVDCAPYALRPDQLSTPDGSQPLLVVACVYASAPDGRVYYHLWGDLTLGPVFIDGLRAGYATVPGLESTRWTFDGLDQGPYTSTAGPAGTPFAVQVFACYDRAPACMSITAPDLETARVLWGSWQPSRQ
ncbi:serine/threonine-protein kinase [Blastococcus sp. SYSU D00820]